jgi:hypothetical protein
MKTANVRRIRKQDLTRHLVPDGTKFDPQRHFFPHEVSHYIERYMAREEWLDLVSDDPSFLEDVINKGLVLEGTVDRYVPLFGYMRDRRGKAVMVRKGSQIKSLEDIGIFTHLDKVSDSNKAGKYINRIISPPIKGFEPSWGEEIGWDAETRSRPLLLRMVAS